MDPRHFDSLVRACAGARTRRRLIAALAALPLAGGLAGLTPGGVEAESPRDRFKRRQNANRRKRRNRKRHNNKNNNKKNNGGGGKLGAGKCVPPTTNDQPTNLQQIINNASPFANIVLCAGEFVADGLRITKDVSLIGAGATGQTNTALFGANVDGGGTNTSGILGIVSGNVFISNLGIFGANGDVPAIGIEGGTVTLAGVIVGNNSAGGIVNLGGTLHLTQGTQVIDNGDDAEGGGILHRGGTTTVASGCLIQGNKATDGGGIYDDTGGTGDIQLADTFIVANNTPNNCSPVDTIQNCIESS
jgi:hypothetical protein